MWAYSMIVTVTLLTLGWMLVSSRSDRVTFYEHAALSGTIVAVVGTAPKAAALPMARGLSQFVSSVLLLTIYSWLVQLAAEDSIIQRPDTLEPLPDRWPDWLQEGL